MTARLHQPVGVDWLGTPWRVIEELADERRRREVRDRRTVREPRKGPTMVIITWKQRGGARHISEAYTMRAVVKPINARTEPPFVVEREHVDAAGGRGWIPANHTHAVAIICKAFLQLAADPGALITPRPTIDLGLLDLPEE